MKWTMNRLSPKHLQNNRDSNTTLRIKGLYSLPTATQMKRNAVLLSSDEATETPSFCTPLRWLQLPSSSTAPTDLLQIIGRISAVLQNIHGHFRDRLRLLRGSINFQKSQLSLNSLYFISQILALLQASEIIQSTGRASHEDKRGVAFHINTHRNRQDHTRDRECPRRAQDTFGGGLLSQFERFIKRILRNRTRVGQAHR